MSATLSKPTPLPTPLPALIGVRAVAEMFGCSSRHVYRLESDGHMPRAVRLGALVRWSRAEIENWVTNGCPAAETNGHK